MNPVKSIELSTFDSIMPIATESTPVLRVTLRDGIEFAIELFERDNKPGFCIRSIGYARTVLHIEPQAANSIRIW
ncbi:MAG: hypothetical protein ABIH23_08395 [bacterium]